THPTQSDSLDMVKRFVKFGSSPRRAQGLLLAGQIRALFEGRFAASIDDVRAVALPALRHRVLLNFEGEAEGIKTDDVLREIMKHLPETLKYPPEERALRWESSTSSREPRAPFRAASRRSRAASL